MISFRNNREIIRRIIKAIPVKVMNMFIGAERSAYHFLNDISVLCEVVHASFPIRNFYPSVPPSFVNVTNGLPHSVSQFGPSLMFNMFHRNDLSHQPLANVFIVSGVSVSLVQSHMGDRLGGFMFSLQRLRNLASRFRRQMRAFQLFGYFSSRFFAYSMSHFSFGNGGALLFGEAPFVSHFLHPRFTFNSLYAPLNKSQVTICGVI